MRKYFWAIESRKLIFRSEILAYPKILEILKDKNRKAKILDAGCGTGKLCELLYKAGFRNLYGIDKSKEAIEIAKSKNNKINYKVGDVTKLRRYYKTFSFDVVISTFVTLYLKERELLEFFIQSFKILKNKGLFIIADVHPFLPITQPKTRWEKWDSKNIDYFKTDEIKQTIFLPKDTNGNKRESFHVKWVHHPFFSYLNKLIDAGFKLKRIHELKPNKGILGKYNKMWGEEVRIPVYFILEMNK